MVTVLLVIGAIVSSVVSYRTGHKFGRESIVIPEHLLSGSSDSTAPDCKHILEYLPAEDRKILETALEKAEPRLSQAAYIILHCLPDTYVGDVTKKCIQRGVWLPTRREAEMIMAQIIYGHQKDDLRAILKKFCPSSLP
jgi:hypothetical protein